MDEDFYGNAVGSYALASKSVVARQALQNLVTELQNQANVGIMSFALPGDKVTYWYVHNAMPFASYNPASYCANPPPDCVTYCTTGDSTAQDQLRGGLPGSYDHNLRHRNELSRCHLSTAVYPFTLI